MEDVVGVFVHELKHTDDYKHYGKNMPRGIEKKM